MSNDGEKWGEEVRWLRGLALRLVADPDLADELAQETALVALSRSSRVDPEERSWRIGVLRRLISNRIRARARRHDREALAIRPPTAPSAEELVEQVEIVRALSDAVLALEEPYRRTVILRYFHDLSAAEIARRTGDPEPTVRSRLQRALVQLRESLDSRSGGDCRKWAVPIITWIGLTAGGAGTASALTTGDPAAASSDLLPSVSSDAAALGGALVSAKKTATVVAFIVLAATAGWWWSGARDLRKGDTRSSEPIGAMASVRETDADDTTGNEPVAELPGGDAFQVGGVVLDRHTESPIAGATVSLRDDERTIVSVVTDASGRFSLLVPEGIESRTPTLVASSDRHLAESRSLWLRTAPWSDPIPPFLLSAGWPLDGIVVDASGDPVADSLVMAIGRVHTESNTGGAGSEFLLRGRALPAVSSGSDGRFRVILPRGEAIVLARRDAARGYARAAVPEAVGSEFEIRVEDTQLLTGVVVDESGAPIAGAIVEAAGRRWTVPGGLALAESLGTSSDVTEVHGRFELMIPGDPQQIVVRHPDFLLWPSRETALPSPEVGPGDEIEVVLRATRNLHGRFVDSDGASISPPAAELRIDRWNSLAEIDETDGRFSVEGVASDASTGTLRIRDALTVELEWGDVGGDVELGDVLVDPGAAIVVRVAANDGAPIVGAAVQLKKSGSTSEWFSDAFGRTDDSGVISLSGLPAAPVDAIVWATGFVETEVRIDSDEHGSIVEVMLDRPGALVGRCVDPGGNVISGAVIEVQKNEAFPGSGNLGGSLSREQPREILTDVTGEDGAFRFPFVPPDMPLRLLIAVPGSIPVRIQIDGVVAGEERDLGDVAVGGTGGLIVAVTDPAGSPLSRALVQLSEPIAPGSRWSGLPRVTEISDQDGLVRFRNIGEGMYTIEARVPGYLGFRADHDLVGDGTLSVVLERGSTWEVQVVDASGLPISGAEIRVSTSDPGQWVRGRSDRMGVARVGPLGEGARRYGVSASGHAEVEGEVEHLSFLPERIELPQGGIVRVLTVRPVGGPPLERLNMLFTGLGVNHSYGGVHVADYIERDLPAGRYFVRISAEGYPLEESEVECIAGETVEVVFAPISDHRPVAVQVVDAMGQIVRAATVEVFPHEPMGIFKLAETQPGSYEGLVPGGDVALDIIACAEDRAPGLAAAVLASESPFRIQLDAPSSIDLVIIDEGGEPVPGIEIERSLVGGQNPRLAQAYRSTFGKNQLTDPSGRAAIGGLTAGEYRITLSRDLKKLREFTVDVAADTIIPYEVQLAETRELGGRVLRDGAPLAGGEIQLTGMGGDRAQIQPDGSFHLEVSGHERGDFAVIEGTGSWLFFRDRPLTPGRPIILEVTTVSGTIHFDSPGHSLGSIRVSFRGTTANATLSLEEDGVASYRGLPAGEYTLSTSLPEGLALATHRIELTGGRQRVRVVEAERLRLLCAEPDRLQASLVSADGHWRSLQRSEHPDSESSFWVPPSDETRTIVIERSGFAPEVLRFSSPIGVEAVLLGEDPGGVLVVAALPAGFPGAAWIGIEVLDGVLDAALARRHWFAGFGVPRYELPLGQYRVTAQQHEAAVIETEVEITAQEWTPVEW